MSRFVFRAIELAGGPGIDLAIALALIGFFVWAVRS